MRRKTALTSADVRKLMLAARAEAERGGYQVSIAIVDEAGVLLALERLDNARLHTPEAAWLKARTAAIVRSETAALEHEIAANSALLAFRDRLPLTGGMPIVYDGEVVGGVGSSGAQPNEDTKICLAAIKALIP